MEDVHQPIIWSGVFFFFTGLTAASAAHKEHPESGN